MFNVIIKPIDNAIPNLILAIGLVIAGFIIFSDDIPTQQQQQQPAKVVVVKK